MKIIELDGKRLYYSLLAGAEMLMKHYRHLDEINVFPVADADTGTNLASTFRTVLERTRYDNSFDITALSMAEAALEGARGNSGIIFAQFLNGLSMEGLKSRMIDTEWFARLADRAARSAREAIAEPVEGTMITVMRDWADAVSLLKEKTDDFHHLIIQSHQAAVKSLRETTQKLEVLARANVVDAGAKGFVLFLEGITGLLRHRSLRTVLRGRNISLSNRSVDVKTHGSSSARYCIEALITGDDLDTDNIREILMESGDSVMVAGSRRKLKAHVHTDRPADLFDRLGRVGSLPFQKAEDTLRQYETAHARKWNIALVTDSTCDLPLEIIDRYQINVVPVNILFGETNYLDKITITPERFYRMAGTVPDWPTSSQPGEKTFSDRYAFLASHYDSVIAVHLSKQLSGTWSNSMKAAEKVSKETGKRVSVIDSRHLSGSLGLIVLRAARAIESGMDHEGIVAAVEQWKDRTNLLVSVMTLDYMVRSGRVSPMKGKLANLLNLKPIISVNEEGRLVFHQKAFSRKGNMKKVMKLAEKTLSGRGVWGYSVVHAHDADIADWFARKMEALLGRPPEFIIDISPAIGLHAGRGAAAVAAMEE